MTLTDLCEKLRNWFDVRRHFGTFTIENGTIDLDFIREGRFYRLIGGVNSGVYYFTGEYLQFIKEGYHEADGQIKLEWDKPIDETFTGAVWELEISKNFIIFYANIGDWLRENDKVLNSPFQSESFGGGGYNYTKASGESLTVWSNFASDLARWQKI